MHALMLVLTLLVPGAKPAADQQPIPIRDVRVIIARDAPSVRIRINAGLTLQFATSELLALPKSDKWLKVEFDGRGTLRLPAINRSAETVRISPKGSDTLQLQIRRDGKWQDELTYPGSLTAAAQQGSGIDLINHVNIESYVAAVVAREVWPTFHEEALRAQAIAARTFVLFQMKSRNWAPYDVTATQSSQVYRGLRADKTGRRASQATADTRGLVLTWTDGKEPRIFCAYYSAVCGGMSQSASIFGPENDVAPLAGGVRCNFCKDAPGDTYRWGPVTIALDEVLARLVNRDENLKNLGTLRDIAVTDRTPAGRPVRLRLTGSSGESEEMLAERFRLIVNANRILSTDFRMTVKDGTVTFDRGKGFGHGLGLCQWGMQGQALAGRRAGEILRYYYPGAEITRVY